MGRRTYEGFAGAWPNMEEETGEFGVRMNNLPHYVVSATLAEEQAMWNNTTIIRDNVVEQEGLLFRDGTKLPLELAATQTLDSGVVILTYRPAAPPE